MRIRGVIGPNSVPGFCCWFYVKIFYTQSLCSISCTVYVCVQLLKFAFNTVSLQYNIFFVVVVCIPREKKGKGKGRRRTSLVGYLLGKLKSVFFMTLEMERISVSFREHSYYRK